jgi:hypothetical protein
VQGWAWKIAWAPHTLTCALYVGHCLHNLLSLSAPTLNTQLPRGWGYFSSPTCSLTIPHILHRCHTSYLLAYEDGKDSVFQNVSILSYRHPGITQKKSQNIKFSPTRFNTQISALFQVFHFHLECYISWAFISITIK